MALLDFMERLGSATDNKKITLGVFIDLKKAFDIVIVMYLYSAQYLHILQDSKRYLTNSTVQVQPQLTSNWHSPNWKIEAQGWPFINVLEVL